MFDQRWAFALRAALIWSAWAGSGAIMADDRAVADAAPQESAREDLSTELGGEIYQLHKGGSSRAQRLKAIDALPLDRLTEDQRKSVERVIRSPGMYRRFPTITFPVQPDVYQFLLTHPDVAVSTWRAMEISKFQLSETAPDCYSADAGDGSVGTVELLHQTAEETLIYTTGSFKSPVLTKPIEANSVMRVRTSFTRESDGRIFATHHGDMFVEFPSQTVDTVARIIAPVSHLIADRNFRQLSLYVHLMSKMIEEHPGWANGMGQRLDGIPETRRREFVDLTRRYQLPAPIVRGRNPDDVVAPWKLYKLAELPGEER